VLVSGDFAPWGGMDRANYELAWHLADRVGAAVHLVGHFVDRELAAHPRVAWHRVPKPLNSYTLGGPLLARRGWKMANSLARQGARVVVNGGNCPWPDINWVHALHGSWKNRDASAPVWFRLKNYWTKRAARRAEAHVLRRTKVVLANSDRTRQQILARIGIPPERVHVVYLGIDPTTYRPVSEVESAATRRALAWRVDRPVAAFIGALGYDRNKGFDVLFSAWKLLCHDPAWDVDLVAVGGGAELDFWRKRALATGLGERIRILGYTKQVRAVLAAADALVSPTHYDAYGLGVHEALCCGLPAFVTCSAGIAERYPCDLTDLLLANPPGVDDLTRRLRQWRRDMAGYRARVTRFSATLRQRTWADMAADIVNILEQTS
jgi:glycosyltransferase involved in cell wall biosynthesis